MRNLAGDPKCDAYIAEELRRCGILPVAVEKSKGEVGYSIEGRLDYFEFRRAWYYWVVKGHVPLDVANELYATEVGKTDIRVSGHCGCPPPEAPWIKWIAPDGKKVIPVKEKEGFERLEKEGLLVGQMEKYHFCDNPETLGAKAYVDTYHIDSELGLYIFSEAMKRHNVSGAKLQEAR